MSIIGFGSNIASLQAQRRLADSVRAVQSTYERLASGQRINRASDDAAGLAVTASLHAQSRIFNQAVLNANDGISLLGIAEGALQQANSILDRITELSFQSANGAFSRTQRISLDVEAKQLVKEYNRIFASTKFNGRTLLDGSLSSLSLQLGIGNDGVLQNSLGGDLSRSIGTGSFGSSINAENSIYDVVHSADFNNDGRDDILVTDTITTYVLISNGNGTFSDVGTAWATVGYVSNVDIADFNADGIKDLVLCNDDLGTTSVYFGNGNGTFRSETTLLNAAAPYIAVGDFTGDNIADIALHDGISTFRLFRNNGTGSFTLQTSFQSSETLIESADFDGNGTLDLLTHDLGTATVRLNSGSGSFSSTTTFSISAQSLAVGDMNHDGLADIVTGGSNRIDVRLGRGDGSFQNSQSYSSSGNNDVFLRDNNKDGFLDLMSFETTGRQIKVAFNLGDGTLGEFSATTLIGSGAPRARNVGDFNGDGVTDVISEFGTNGIRVNLANSQSVTTLQSFNLTTQAEAKSTMDLIASARLRVQNELGRLGAGQRRLEVALGTLFESRDQSIAAANRIKDADIAHESSQLIRNQILQQASSAIVGQANLAPQIALSLLQAA